MIMESKYRRKALAAWERSREESKKELLSSYERAKTTTRNPITAFFLSVFAWFTQQ